MAGIAAVTDNARTGVIDKGMANTHKTERTDRVMAGTAILTRRNMNIGFRSSKAGIMTGGAVINNSGVRKRGNRW
jgi:hypothetical protein